VVIGDGSEKKKLMHMANKNIKFLHWQPRSELKRYYAGCRALIFPGEEDFGIVPVEVQACGKPVIAFGKGGVLESVRGAYPGQTIHPSHTGIFFYPQTKEALIEAVRRFDAAKFSPERIRKQALRFDRKVFKERIKEFIDRKFEEHRKSLR